ncbi:MAG TPA: tetratricopeptide repeat protein [Candidatus Binatia bacterium]|nr:tetratricopeptide repeat protein [Candidatus Binatia bacterium]
MAGDRETAARQAREGVAVSTGDSSASTPQPALDLEGATLPGVDSAFSPAGKGDSSEAATVLISDTPRPRSSGSAPPHPIFSSIGATIFHQGDVLGGRYEIQKLLGMGGMGAVYKARDMEVERMVALKVIRPDLAGNPAILARFKQELVLARQVTHKNIIRIHDLNEAEGVKFITMEFVEGEDLRSILSARGKLSPDEAVPIVLQVCAGLQAAHAEGVIHRDLKPGNIMRDTTGRVVIMDFGLARSLQGDGMTQTGMMIGTMEYMSPEQALGKELDARSDEFAVGLILYELLTGFMPHQADSPIASLVKRTQEDVIPLVKVDSNIPADLSAIVCRCLERDPQKRFPSVHELAEELNMWQWKRPGGGLTPPSRTTGYGVATAHPARRLPLQWIAGGIMAVLLVVGAVVATRYWKAGGKAVVQGPVTSLAIVPLYNASGDPSLSWMGSSIADALTSDIGQSAHLRQVSPERLQQVLRDLGVSPQSQLDVSTLRRIADYTHADTVVSGQYERLGGQTRISLTVHDLRNDQQVSLTTDVAGEKELLGSLEKLADNLRGKVAATPEILRELQAHSQHVTTKSIPALRAYDEGSQLATAGNYTKAVSKFEEATAQDPNFALAFSRLAQTYAALGYDDKAEWASRRAVALSDNLPAQDRFLIQANHASILHDTAKAIAAYEELAKVNPDDTDVQFALGKLYEDANRFDDAKKHLASVLASDPNNITALLASGRVDIRSNDFQAALDPLNRALSLAIRSGNQEEKGNVLQALGVAYQRLNEPDDALRNFQQALEIRRKIGDQRGIAMSLLMIGQIQDAMGDSRAALASWQEGIEVDRKIGNKDGLLQLLMTVGGSYLDHAKYDEALKPTNEALQIARDAGDEISQATLLMNIGNAHFSKGEYQDALTYFQQSYDIRSRLKVQADASESLHNLAQTNFKLGQYDTALTQYLKALDGYRAAGNKNGVALVSSDMGALFAEQGRYDAALKAQQEAVNTYRQLNDRTYQMVWALAGYGNTLAAVGRQEEGRKYIQEALQLAGEVKEDNGMAAALNYQGDSYFYGGDYAAARQFYGKALDLGTKAKLRDAIVQAKLNLAKLDVAQGHSQSAIATLKKIREDAGTMGLKTESVEASVYLGQASLDTRHPEAAQQELEVALGRAEKLGLQVQQARAQYLLGMAMGLSGRQKEAIPHYREAVKILESISKQEGAGRVLERSDLAGIYRDAARSYQGVS